jgi:hypothetical protein
MEQWLEWARGPAFRFAFVLMALGLVRHIFMTAVGVIQALRRAGDKTIPYKVVFMTTLQWLLPLKKLGNRLSYSVTSVAFHIGLILTPVFLLPHIGITWPSLPHVAVDILTLITIAAAVGLLIGRLGSGDSRRISRAQDIILPVAIAAPFVTGFLAMHPAWNPIGYNATMFLHVMSANLIFVSIPFTKLGHIVILPATQLVSEVAWHFPAESGDDVTIALKKENVPI